MTSGDEQSVASRSKKGLYIQGEFYQQPENNPANFIIFGGKIVSDGIPQEYKTQDGKP